MDGILLDTLIQAVALGVVAYIVLQWKREDEQQARQQLESLTNQVTEPHPKNLKLRRQSHYLANPTFPVFAEFYKQTALYWR